MSRGPGVVQRKILAALDAGPATNLDLYRVCQPADQRDVRRAVRRLWITGQVERIDTLDHGLPLWGLPGS